MELYTALENQFLCFSQISIKMVVAPQPVHQSLAALHKPVQPAKWIHNRCCRGGEEGKCNQEGVQQNLRRPVTFDTFTHDSQILLSKLISIVRYTELDLVP